MRELTEQARRRRLERHCSASIRALSSVQEAGFRKHQLHLGEKVEPLAVPHLGVDMGLDSLDRCRGVADALAMRLMFSDRNMHLGMMPEEAVESLVFDIAEQLRVETLAPESMAGIRKNLDSGFSEWCRKSRADGLTENEFGLLIYSLTHMIRVRLGGVIGDEEVEGLIESPRFLLGPLIGKALLRMAQSKDDQFAYAQEAIEVAKTIGQLVGGEDAEHVGRYIAALRAKNLLPPMVLMDDRFGDDSEDSDGVVLRSMEPATDYHVFCQDYDREYRGDELFRLAQRQDLRKSLDQMVSAQTVSVTRLAQRLLPLFSVQHRAGWHDGEEEGYIDGRRLCQVVARPGFSRVFKQERQVPRCDTVLTFLIDNSGSMKKQRFESVAILVDMLSRALELAGVTTEILGFTTRGWTGGESIKAWREAGSPGNPGRLNDRLHIVYKDADTSCRRSRLSVASLLNPLHFREGLDGEALSWAKARLMTQPEKRKCLVMISDGAPMDSATSNYNREYFLESHLREVARSIEREGLIELKAISTGLDLDEFFRETVALDIAGTLDRKAFGILETLFAVNSRHSLN